MWMTMSNKRKKTMGSTRTSDADVSEKSSLVDEQKKKRTSRLIFSS
jgi:hypothetical protein